MSGPQRPVPPDSGELLRIGGLVQGVGMRPTIWRLARSLGLRGSVCNNGDEVLVRLWGPQSQRDALVRSLLGDTPPLARIRSLERASIGDAGPAADFRIADSRPGPMRHGLLPDAATCPACRAEIRDPRARRYRHAFANCTHCGPRLSVLRSLPYDRAHTSMAEFAMCSACAAEFRDPADRRFHAQPIACPDCGPRLWLETAAGDSSCEGWTAIERAAQALAEGRIVALKGIGGFHLAVDAHDDDAVTRLRARKHRPHKPFALMAADPDTIRRYCRLPEAAATLLDSAAAPIVLLDRIDGASLPESVAPLQRCLGFMLPHSPLHLLLMQAFTAAGGGPLIMTSGNRSDAPPCTANADARTALAGIADLWLMHDREIVHRVDDSVAQFCAGVPRMLRRARGYAPAPLAMPRGFEQAPVLLSAGAQLKNCPGLLFDGQALLAPHVGDLHDAGAADDFRRAVDFYRSLCPPLRGVAVDAHPDYAASRYGRALAAAAQLPLHEVQHHHAHAASCLADNGVPADTAPVLALVLDGTGYGDDGSIWGGELLRCDYRHSTRLGRLRPVGLPGGAAAIREPWRCAYSYLRSAGLWAEAQSLSSVQAISALSMQPWPTLEAMLARKLNAPQSSAAGRLFDAVAALLGLVPQSISYEGQAAMALQACADGHGDTDEAVAYPFALQLTDGLLELDWAPMFAALLADLPRSPAPEIAARFHRGLSQALCAGLRRVAGQTRCVALSGGVFQNVRLLTAVTDELERDGFTVLSHRQVPCNDGGLALGQLAIAAARMLSPVDPSLAESLSCA